MSSKQPRSRNSRRCASAIFTRTLGSGPVSRAWLSAANVATSSPDPGRQRCRSRNHASIAAGPAPHSNGCGSESSTRRCPAALIWRRFDGAALGPRAPIAHRVPRGKQPAGVQARLPPRSSAGATGVTPHRRLGSRRGVRFAMVERRGGRCCSRRVVGAVRIAGSSGGVGASRRRMARGALWVGWGWRCGSVRRRLVGSRV